MNKIGIMGGTFNPVHLGHITLAKRAYEEYGLDKVLFMISPNPPHKKDNEILDIIHRSKMVEIALQDIPSYIEYSDFELKRDGYIYTADTLLLLKKQYPNTEFYFILGSDSLFNIEKWYHPEIVLSNAVILVALRDNLLYSDVLKEADNLIKKYNARISIMHLEKIDISSTKIRKMLASNEDVSLYLDGPVYEYIKENKLYI